MVRALHDPALRERLAALGAEPAGSSPQALGASVRKEYDKWGKAVREAGIKLDCAARRRQATPVITRQGRITSRILRRLPAIQGEGRSQRRPQRAP